MTFFAKVFSAVYQIVTVGGDNAASISLLLNHSPSKWFSVYNKPRICLEIHGCAIMKKY